MPKRHRVTTISIDKELKERLANAILNRDDLKKKIDTADDLIIYMINVIEQGKDI